MTKYTAINASAFQQKRLRSIPALFDFSISSQQYTVFCAFFQKKKMSPLKFYSLNWYNRQHRMSCLNETQKLAFHVG